MTTPLLSDERIKDISKNWSHNYQTDAGIEVFWEHDDVENAIKQALSEQREVSEWISVENELPEHRNDVLIKSRNGCVGIGWWSQGEVKNLTVLYLAIKDLKSTLEGEILANEVTCWQPLPPAPPEKDND